MQKFQFTRRADAGVQIRQGGRRSLGEEHLDPRPGRADYQGQYEPSLYGWKDGHQRDWCGARDQGDVWFIDKPVHNDLHPTMKPVALIERAIRNSSKTPDIVLDPFGGSGSTLIACEKAGRQARLIELDPRYVDVIVHRFEDYSGKAVILEHGATGGANLVCDGFAGRFGQLRTSGAKQSSAPCGSAIALRPGIPSACGRAPGGRRT